MSQAEAPAADWYPDPSGRFEFRYWDGDAWTGHVSTSGKTDWDPPGEDEPAEQVAAETPADDATWAPEAEPEPAAVEPEPAPAAEPEPAPVAEAQPAAAVEGGAIEAEEAADANVVANQRAALESDVEGWVNEVASQVEPRLSRINPHWTTEPQAEAARACAYGLLLGHLAHLHPHMRSELSQVAESHPSFTTLEAGNRLSTLELIAGDAERRASWLGPLIATPDPAKVSMLFD